MKLGPTGSQIYLAGFDPVGEKSFIDGPRHATLDVVTGSPLARRAGMGNHDNYHPYGSGPWGLFLGATLLMFRFMLCAYIPARR
jgi:hypothetical protein